MRKGYGTTILDPVETTGRVFVLGAGASVFAGYPLASDLLAFIRNFQTLEVNTRGIASKVLDKLTQAEFFFKRNIVRDPNRNSNLEELLTYLELYQSFPGTPFAVNPWDATDSSGIRRVITEKFLSHQYDLNKIVWGTETSVTSSIELVRMKKVFDAWAELVSPGDVILTFNWDILHEIILWRAGLWTYKDGYGFRCASQGDNEEPAKVVVLKLHGSVNWVQENQSSPVNEIADIASFFSRSKDWEPRNHHSQAQRDSGRKLVLPTYLKDISSNRALLDIWTMSHMLISRASELIVVGYSLNPADHPARLLFGTALSENRGLSQITIVSPEMTAWDSFLSNLNKPMHRIRKTFEDWVRSKPSPTSRPSER
jgi:hypothetical protein